MHKTSFGCQGGPHRESWQAEWPRSHYHGFKWCVSSWSIGESQSNRLYQPLVIVLLLPTCVIQTARPAKSRTTSLHIGFQSWYVACWHPICAPDTTGRLSTLVLPVQERIIPRRQSRRDARVGFPVRFEWRRFPD
jgi:hypothetical protein